jgi:predicted nucleic acid-binding protein
VPKKRCNPVNQCALCLQTKELRDSHLIPAGILGLLRDGTFKNPNPYLMSLDYLELPTIAQKHSLTNYDAAYLALAIQLRLPLATTDVDLRRASQAAGVEIVAG